MTAFAAFWTASRAEEGSSLPLLLWRESAAQHFAGPRGGNYDPSMARGPRAMAHALGARAAAALSQRPLTEATRTAPPRTCLCVAGLDWLRRGQ